MNLFRFSLLLVCYVAGALGSIAQAGDVIVALHESVSTVSDQTIRIGDVASVFGGTAWDRRNIDELDLESLKDQHDCSITRKQVQMRLLLAGYKRETFRVTGPTVVTARFATPLQIRSELEQSLQSEISRHFAIDRERISVRLTNPSHLASLEQSLSPGDFSIELMPRNEFPIGRTRLRTNLIDASGIRQSVTFDTEVSLAMKVAIASEPIPRGTVIKPGMFRLVDRAITEKADYLNPDSALGRTTGRYIANNSILLASYLAARRSGGNQAVMRNDLLDVVIPFGRGEIRLKDARAMESGIVGDTIEVLNPQTNRRINALILGPNLATVSSHPRRF